MTARLTKVERYCAGRQFSRNLRNLERAEVFWIPSTRGITMRALFPKIVFRLPVGAVSIGIYEPPFKTDDFLDDLEALLVKLESSDATQREHDAALVRASAV